MSEVGRLRPSTVDGLEVTDVADGLVVYQPSPERVHYLNNTAAAVFVLCTGELSVAEIAQEIGDVFGLGEPPVSEVETCVKELQQKAVLQ